MSRQPTKEELTAIFKAIDTNGDGHVSVDEFYKALGEKNFKKDEIVLLVGHLDKNKDGKIDVEGLFCSIYFYFNQLIFIDFFISFIEFFKLFNK